MSEDDAILAGEFALGLLEDEERRAAARRRLADPDFAAQVAWWHDRLAGFCGTAAPVEPPVRLQARVMAAIAPPPAPSLARWRTGAIAAMLVAAVLIVLVLARPDRVVPPARPIVTAPLLVATLAGKSTAPVSAVYDPAARSLALTVAGGWRRDRSAELWIIAPRAQPRALGLLPRGDATRLRVAADMGPALAAGATLAISIEPAGGSRTGLPTGPVIASGTLARLPA